MQKLQENKQKVTNNFILPQIILESVYCPICEVSYLTSQKDDHKKIHFSRLNETKIVQIPNFKFKSFEPIPQFNIQQLISNILLKSHGKRTDQSSKMKKEVSKQDQGIPLPLSAKKPDDWSNTSPQVLRTSNLSERSHLSGEQSHVDSIIEENNVGKAEINDTLKIKSKVKRLPSNILARIEHRAIQKLENQTDPHSL